jgi:hypothetical protein
MSGYKFPKCWLGKSRSIFSDAADYTSSVESDAYGGEDDCA